MRHRFTLAAAVLLASAPLLGVVDGRSEDRPSARLVYVRKGAATSCPDEAGMRAGVTARLGYDPFRPDAERTVVVTMTREGAGFAAALEVQDAKGVTLGERKLASNAKDCDELAGSVAIALAVAIDPLGIGPAPSAEPSSSTLPVASSAPPSAPSPAPPQPIVRRPREPEPAARASLVTSFGIFAAYGAAPDLTAGLSAGVGVRFPSWSLAVEGRVNLEARRAGPLGGEVKSSLLLASLVPCVHEAPFFACVVGALGALRGAGAGVDVATSDTTLYAAVGPRLGLEAALVSAFSLRASLDVLATLTRTTLRIREIDAWTTPPVSVLAGLALVGRF